MANRNDQLNKMPPIVDAHPNQRVYLPSLQETGLLLAIISTRPIQQVPLPRLQEARPIPSIVDNDPNRRVPLPRFREVEPMPPRKCRRCRMPLLDANRKAKSCVGCREFERRRRRDWKDSGKCIRCGQRPPKLGGSQCQLCLGHAANARKYRQQSQSPGAWTKMRHDNGLCTRCGSRPVAEGKRSCAGCLVSKKLYRRRKRAERLAASTEE